MDAKTKSGSGRKRDDGHRRLASLESPISVQKNKKIIYRSGTKFIRKIPKAGGKCVGIMKFKGKLIVACENKIYELVEGKIHERP